MVSIRQTRRGTIHLDMVTPCTALANTKAACCPKANNARIVATSAVRGRPDIVRASVNF